MAFQLKNKGKKYESVKLQVIVLCVKFLRPTSEPFKIKLGKRRCKLGLMKAKMNTLEQSIVN